MSTAAANIVTNAHAAVAARGATSSPPAKDDGFASVLDGVVQSGDDAKTGDATSTAPKDTPTPAVAAMLLAARHAAANSQTLSKPSASDAASPNTDTDDASDAPHATDDTATSSSDADAAAATPQTVPIRAAKPFDGAGRASKVAANPQAHGPLAHPAHTVSDDKPAAEATDPAQVQAGPVIANAAVPPPAPSGMCSGTTAPDPAPGAADVAPSALPAIDDGDAVPTDIAAASMLGSGTTVKPAKPGEAQKPQPDSAKSQARPSTAITLADAAKVVSHTFADQKIVTALPVHPAADTARPGDKPGATPVNSVAPPTNTNASQATAAPSAQPASPAAPAATVAHAQAAPQTAPAVATAIANATPLAGSAATKISAQLQIGHPAQPDVTALAVTIAAKSEGGARHFDIRLDPAELGRVDVHLTVDDAGKAQATLSVEKPQTLDLLQKDQPQLERALKEAGLDLTQNGLNFSLKGQQQQAGGGDHAPFARGRTLAVHAVAAVDNTASAVSLGQMSSGDTRLDIRV